MPNLIEHTYAGIRGRLAAVRRKQNGAAIVHGVVISFFLLLVLSLAAMVLEGLFYMPAAARSVLFWCVLAAPAAVLAFRAGVPLMRLLGVIPGEPDERTAAFVGERFPLLHDRLLNLLQLHREWAQSVHSGNLIYSPELIDAAAADLEGEISPLNFLSAVSYAGSRRAGRFLGIAAALTGLLLVTFPGSFFGSAYRLLHHDTAFAAPLPFRLLVEPGNKDVIKGANVTVIIRAEGEPVRHIVLSSKPDGQIAFEDRTVDAGPDGVFRVEFPALKVSTEYEASAGEVRTERYRLSVVDRPLITSLRVRLVFPSYAKIPPRQLDENTGDVTALRGTSVGLSVESNKPLSKATLVFGDSTRIALSVDGARAQGSTVLMKDRTYHVQLADTGGTGSADPIEYTMRITPDAFPTVAILVPGMNIDIADNSALPMTFRIGDDFGFSRLRLAYKLVQSRFEAAAENFTYADVPLPSDGTSETIVPYTWALDKLHLAPEDVVTYYAEVFDNDNVSGPKSAVSETYTLRLPSLGEVFADVDKTHQVSVETLREAVKQSEQARKDIEELRQDLKEEGHKLDWQDKKKAEEVAKRYENIQKNLEDVNRAVDKMVNGMQKNKVLSPETLEKYQELQQLMEQLNSPELAEALKKLQQSIQQMSPEAMQQALQQFQFSEENFRKGIERTLNLLKRIQIEQKVDEASKRAEELLRAQNDLKTRTDSLGKDGKAADKLAREQQDLKKQAGELAKQLADLQKRMEEFPGEMPLSQMENITRDMQQSNLDKQMEQVAQQLAQGQMSEASRGQQQAAGNMQKFSEQLKRMKEQMQSNQTRQAMKEMRRTMQDLLDLSRRQEALKNDSRGLEPNSSRFREHAQRQMEMLQDLANVAQRMSGLGQKSLGVTPEMGKGIGEAARSMGEATRSLDQRNGGAAEQQQTDAMGALNESAALVQNAMNAMAQGNGQGMGMAGLLQRIQQMAGMQQGVNQGTQQLGMSPEQAASMARLAGEQGMVRKSLEQLAKEAAGSGQLNKILGDMNRVAQEMREVQTDLAQGNVNPETLRKQDRILSRLLDASRSARERDFEKQRKSESGTNVARTGPGQIDPSTLEGRNRLRRDLLRALEEGYSRDYEELIRKYFEAVEQSPAPTDK